MSFSLYEASAPVFARGLTHMAGWLDTAKAAGVDEPAMMQARLAPDMRPFPAQFQIASDTAKGAVARLSGQAAPAMADTEASFADLAERCRKTVAFIEGVDRAAFAGAEDRQIELRLRVGGYRWSGRDYLTAFALPNFFFHASMAYAILRANGMEIGKNDFLQLGAPDPALAA